MDDFDDDVSDCQSVVPGDASKPKKRSCDGDAPTTRRKRTKSTIEEVKGVDKKRSRRNAADENKRTGKVTTPASRSKPSVPQKTAFTIGEDCAGIGTTALAIRKFDLNAEHAWVSEINPTTRKLLRCAIGGETRIDHDMSKRDHAVLERIDMYVAGFPCQAFSRAGRNFGIRDERGKLVKHVLKTILAVRPRAVLLENVPNLEVAHPKVMKLVLDKLSPAYHIRHRILNSSRFGVPHRRRRLYFAAVRRDALFHKFHWPHRDSPADPEQFLLPKTAAESSPRALPLPHHPRHAAAVSKARARFARKGVDIDDQTVFVDTASSLGFGTSCIGMCPCLTLRRVAHDGIYISNRRRFMKLPEVAAFQGYSRFLSDSSRCPPQALALFRVRVEFRQNRPEGIDYSTYAGAGVSESAFAQCVGNAMTVDVVGRVMHNLATASGLHDKSRV